MNEGMTPLANKKMGMNFTDAINQLRQGAYIARTSWNNSDFCLLKGGFLHIYTKGEFSIWKVSDGDIDGVDWIVTLEEKHND